MLPDTLRDWPWPRSINPHYKVCKAESEAWVEPFEAFSTNGQQAFNSNYSSWSRSCDFVLRVLSIHDSSVYLPLQTLQLKFTPMHDLMIFVVSYVFVGWQYYIMLFSLHMLAFE